MKRLGGMMDLTGGLLGLLGLTRGPMVVQWARG